MWEIVEKLMRSRNITVYKLAKDLNFQPSTFSHWKNGLYTPKTDKLQKIADYFGVSLDYLTTGKQQEGYYENDDVAQIAQAVFDRPELKVLFDASKDSSKEDIEHVVAMLEYLRKKEKNND